MCAIHTDMVGNFSLWTGNCLNCLDVQRNQKSMIGRRRSVGHTVCWFEDFSNDFRQWIVFKGILWYHNNIAKKIGKEIIEYGHGLWLVCTFQDLQNGCDASLGLSKTTCNIILAKYYYKRKWRRPWKKLTYDTGKPLEQLRGNFGAGGMHWTKKEP